MLLNSLLSNPSQLLNNDKIVKTTQYFYVNENISKVEKIESEFKSQQALLAQEKVMARRKLIAIISIFLISIVLFYFFSAQTD